MKSEWGTTKGQNGAESQVCLRVTRCWEADEHLVAQTRFDLGSTSLLLALLSLLLIPQCSRSPQPTRSHLDGGSSPGGHAQIFGGVSTIDRVAELRPPGQVEPSPAEPSGGGEGAWTGLTRAWVSAQPTEQGLDLGGTWSSSGRIVLVLGEVPGAFALAPSQPSTSSATFRRQTG